MEELLDKFLKEYEVRYNRLYDAADKEEYSICNAAFYEVEKIAKDVFSLTDEFLDAYKHIIANERRNH